MDLTKILAEFRRQNAEKRKSARPPQATNAEGLKGAKEVNANAEKSHREILERARKGNQQAQDNFRQMHANADSCVVHGECQTSFCNATRLWLSYLIYGKDKCKIQEQFRTHIDEARKEWKQKAEDEKPEHDYRGRYYETQAGAGHCHPSLIFRGTIPGSDGMAEGVAIYTNVKLYGATIPYISGFWPLGDDEETKNIPESEKANAKFHKITLLDESGWCSLPLISFKNTLKKILRDSPSIPASIILDLLSLTPIHFHLTVAIYAKKKGKCWATNISQAFGKSNFHYPQAKKFGREIARQLDADNAQNAAAAAKDGKPFSSRKKLYCAGHSLGGGLALAAARAAQTKYPKLDVYAAVYNSAAPHPNTLRADPDREEPAAGEEEPQVGEPPQTDEKQLQADKARELRSVPFFTDAVTDEILTTAECFPGKLPFLAAILRLGHLNQGIALNLPQPGQPMEHKALYPDPVVDAIPGAAKDKDGKNFCPPAGKDRYESWLKEHGREVKPGAELPKLWPINEQTLLKDPKSPEKNLTFPELTKLDAIARSSSSAKEFVSNALWYILNRSGDSAKKDSSIWNSIKEYGRAYEKGLLSQLNLRINDKGGLSSNFMLLIFKDYISELWKTECKDVQELIFAAIDYHGMDVAAQSIFLADNEWSSTKPAKE